MTKEFLVTDLRYDTPPPPPGIEDTLYRVRVVLQDRAGARFYMIMPTPSPYAIGDVIYLPAESVTSMPDPARPT